MTSCFFCEALNSIVPGCVWAVNYGIPSHVFLTSDLDRFSFGLPTLAILPNVQRC